MRKVELSLKEKQKYEIIKKLVETNGNISFIITAKSVIEAVLNFSNRAAKTSLCLSVLLPDFPLFPIYVNQVRNRSYQNVHGNHLIISAV